MPRQAAIFQAFLIRVTSTLRGVPDMPTLNIQGKRVKVDDSFLQLSPEEQNRTVDEIAAQIGVAPQPTKGTAAAAGFENPIRVELPDGSIAEFPEGTPNEVMESAIKRHLSIETEGNASRDLRSQQPAPEHDLSTASADTQALASDMSAMTQNPGQAIDAQRVNDAKTKRDEFYNSGIYAGSMNPLGPIAKSIDAGASAAQRSPLFGWDDELTALARSDVNKGDYGKLQAEADAKKTAMRQQNPGASIAGDIGGGLMMARGLPNVVAGRNLPVVGRTGAAMLEGATYGGVTGAGEAKPGERGQGATYGALLGAGISGVASRVGDAVASRAARNTANNAAPTAQELADASQQLYDRAHQSGVAIEPQSANRMFQNMRLAGGRINENLRPQTAGLIDDINALQGQPIDLQRFHELRQEIDLAISRATPSDERTLSRMRQILNAFADNVTPQHVVGPPDAFNTFREADQLWAQRTKTQKIEDLFDLADVKSGRYSQSGMENAIREKASQLYTRIVKRQETSFTPQETALVRQLARGNSSSALMKWIAKFAPRGVVSAGAGAGIGGSIGTMIAPGVGSAIGMALPGAVGHLAAGSVDRAANRSLHALQTAAATGNAPVLGAISNRINPLIGPLSSGLSSQALRDR
ncbi:hypothetical protein [Rhizobium leguminosarum]|uniref:hypothetical protein n=1 Tax=Rhizobium leguminosarum TaxID=384 RepID=UPI001039603E|nr:hypothetical protein [Rhizobium leguminosarum]TBZ00237.1 hypothetical protein E0H49_15905 [Rhizobium leguminosarum bv. viciae]